MNWQEQADKRRKRYIHLCEAKRLCVMAADRVAVMALDDRIRNARARLQYAEKQARFGGRSAMAWPGFVPTDVARFATRDNPAENDIATGK